MTSSHHFNMSKSLAGTETLANLARAFTGESVARNTYSQYAEVARKQGFQAIAEIFEETAEQEKNHANFFWMLLGGNTEHERVVASTNVVTGPTKDTLTNLKAAMESEHEETSSLYPSFADIAEKEGFQQIANGFRHIAQAEACHEQRFKELAEHIEKASLYKRQKVMSWRCRYCGYVSVGVSAPKACPVCFKPQGFFEIAEIL